MHLTSSFRVLLSITLLSLSTLVHAQTASVISQQNNYTVTSKNNYLVGLDNSNCNISLNCVINDSEINGHNFSSAYDQSHHRYFIVYNAENTGIPHILTVNTLTNKISSDVNFSALQNKVFQSLCYDMLTDKIYGIMIDHIAGKKYFVSLGPLDASYNILNTLDQQAYSLESYAAINTLNSTYTFISTYYNYGPVYATNAKVSSTGDSMRIYTLDLNSGALLSNKGILPLDSGYFTYLRYDADLNKFYSILDKNYYNYGNNLVSIDPSTGIFVSIHLMNTIRYPDPSNSSYDAINHRIILISEDKLYSVDVTNGSVIYKPLLPYAPYYMGDQYYVASHFENSFYGIQFDDSLNTTFALRFGPAVNIDNIPADMPLVFPNPFSTSTTILFKKMYSEVKVVIYNSIGEIAEKLNFENTSSIIINKNGLATGNYFALIYADGQKYGTVKLEIQ